MLVRCHAGCDQERVIAALRARGLWVENGPRSLSRIARGTPVENKFDQDDTGRTEAALTIWRASQPAEGTLAETYLRSRGLNLSAPASLRCRPGLKHPSGGVWPAVAALVTLGGTGTSIAIHRTFLAGNGQGKAPLDPAKMMLGPCRGGVVRLGQPAGVLMVGGLPREQAEARVFACCVAEWLNRNPVCSPLDRCLHCGEAEQDHDPLLPVRN